MTPTRAMMRFMIIHHDSFLMTISAAGTGTKLALLFFQFFGYLVRCADRCGHGGK